MAAKELVGEIVLKISQPVRNYGLPWTYIEGHRKIPIAELASKLNI